jgi:RNA polymerase sigma-54 factor
MALSPRMEIRQGQGLVMTPQLQQAIKLLQLSNMELQAYVEQELERNPALEWIEDGERDEFDGPERGPDESGADGGSGESELSIGLDSPDPHAENALDARPDDINPDGDMAVAAAGSTVDWSGVGEGRGGYDDLEGIENSLGSAVTLHDHLEAQASLAFADPADRLIAAWLIDHVDEAGYLRVDLDEAAERLGADSECVSRVAATMRTFDPTGVCARTIEECLAAQLIERDRFDPAMQQLVAHLGLLARRDLRTLCEICEVDGADLADMIAEIRALTPKPGAAFGSSDVGAIVPDVFVREGPHGTWDVELNSDTLPRVLVNNAYVERVSRSARTDHERSFIAEAQADASWLVKSLDQRARTIMKVAREIVRQQDGFLTYGVAHLRPLILKDVATVIEMHESTVSRVTSNKYISTPRGVFELKYFFTASIGSSDGGESHSAEAVRYRIKSLIDGEPGHDPLSDDRIVEILRETGVDIARRTVAKYREAMRIPSSVQRRRDLARSA